jgi:predicted DNA repair protein MutK
VGALFEALAPMVLNAAAGLVTGALVLGVVTLVQRARR